MEVISCDICFLVFSEEFCVPKVLECGHTLCSKCLVNVLQCQKICPTCSKTLTKSLEEYPTNFIILRNNKSSEEKCYRYPDHQEINNLTEMVNSLLSKKETYKNWIEERISSHINELVTSSDESISSLKNEITDSVENFEKMLHKELELSDAAEQKKLMKEIELHSEVKKKIHCSCYEKERVMLQLSQYKNEKHFLYDLVVRFQNDEKIYACEVIGIDGWRYGEITFSENRIHIHCLSSDTIGNDVFVVPFRDLRKCIVSKKDILPFIRIGNEKLIFNLTEDLSIETLRLIKLFTGEGGQTLKGIEVCIDKDYPEEKNESGNNSSDSLQLNRCWIHLLNKFNVTGFEEALYKNILYKINKDDVILQSVKDFVCIYKVPEMQCGLSFPNVVGKLHKDCQIDVNKMRNNKVEDSGICFSL